MSIKYSLGRIALSITLKTPLVSLVLALITIFLLYIISSGTKVDIYESLKGDIKYSDGSVFIEAIASEQMADKDLMVSLFYKTSDGTRYSCRYIGKEKIADKYIFKFAVDDVNYLFNAGEARQVQVDIKAGNITLVEKILFNNRGN